MTAARWACVIAALGAAAYLLLDPATADHAAQEYRAAAVPGVWSNGWYGGHHTPAYGVLSPLLGALLGVRLAGALAAVAAAGLFGPLAERHWGARAGSVAAVWFAVGTVAALVSGRLTFLLGAAIGVGTLLALQRGRWPMACGLAALTSLASPVAALFLAIAALARGISVLAPGVAAASAPRGTTPRAAEARHAAAVAAAALAPAALLAVLFPEGGTEPFVASAFWPALAATVLVALALPSRERTLRIGAVIYTLACVAAFVLPTPLGGNVTRLGALVAGPVLAGAILAGRDRRAVLLALALPLVYWQLYPAVRDVVRASGDPSTSAAYHAPLVAFLESRLCPSDGACGAGGRGRPGSFRVEIAFTENHWEAAHVAGRVALARGWARQLDRRYGELFYDGSIDAATYRAWLDEHAVAYVAVPDVALDYAARGESRLIARGLPYLRPVWRNAHWRVFAVRRPAPLVSGASRTIQLANDGFAIHATRRGDALVRVRHTRWWAVTGGRACVERAPGAMTRIRVLRPGIVRVQARLGGDTCRR